MSSSDPNEFLMILLCLFIMVNIIFLHGVGLRVSSQYFGRSWKRTTLKTSTFTVHNLLGVTITMLVITHMAEVVLWAAPIYWLGLINTFIDSYLFSMGNYTTIGSSINIPNGARILAPMIAISGMFTFGWTGGMLAGVMSQMAKRDHDLQVEKHKTDDADIFISVTEEKKSS